MGDADTTTASCSTRNVYERVTTGRQFGDYRLVAVLFQPSFRYGYYINVVVSHEFIGG